MLRIKNADFTFYDEVNALVDGEMFEFTQAEFNQVRMLAGNTICPVVAYYSKGKRAKQVTLIRGRNGKYYLHLKRKTVVSWKAKYAAEDILHITENLCKPRVVLQKPILRGIYRRIQNMVFFEKLETMKPGEFFEFTVEEFNLETKKMGLNKIYPITYFESSNAKRQYVEIQTAPGIRRFYLYKL